MEIKYDDLKKLAISVRVELSRKGVIDPAKGKLRKKPREAEKTKMLVNRALARAERYKPAFDADKNLYLPYFSTPRKK